MTKTCEKCKVEKDLSSFNKDKSRKDGLQNRCRDCYKSYQNKYYSQNKDTVVKKWRKKNIKKIREHYREYMPKWYKQHPEKSRANSRKRRALKQNLQEIYTKLDEQYTKELFNNKCVVCESKDKLCIDHWMPLSKGYPLTKDNAVLMCNKCNCKKYNKTPLECYSKEFINKIEQMLTNSNY